MSVLLVLTAGQTDVQLIDGSARRELARDRCAALHDEIERRSDDWSLADSPPLKEGQPAESLPEDVFSLCTPKLDAVLRYLDEKDIGLTNALILETRRDAQIKKGDPRFAGTILANRLRQLGITRVKQATYLTGAERLEGQEHPRDAVIRRDVVHRIDREVREHLAAVNPERVLIASTGGMPTVSTLVEEIVLLHAATDDVDSLEVADGSKASPPTQDRAISRRHRTPEPLASYQARRHALKLIKGGNLLGAWGAVQHISEDDFERSWTQVVKWLACFAASQPMPSECDISVLTHPLMAIRAGLRVELALRAEDIPRAVHGTYAFFESAFWDWIKKYDFSTEGIIKISDNEYQLPSGHSTGDRFYRPKGNNSYRINDYRDAGVKAWLPVLNKPGLAEFWTALTEEIRFLRNKVAHNEPSPELMRGARDKMIGASLWASDTRFLTQPLVKCVLEELGVQLPDQLCVNLDATVRTRLLAIPEGVANASRPNNPSEP